MEKWQNTHFSKELVLPAWKRQHAMLVVGCYQRSRVKFLAVNTYIREDRAPISHLNFPPKKLAN